MLASHQAGTPDLSCSLPLADFQTRGSARIHEIISRRGIAILADSVGLGKTFTAMALVEKTVAEGGRVAVVIPSALRSLWRGAVQQLHAPRSIALVSHAILGRGRAPQGRFSLVVVDEAHAFRNPQTRRYHALAELCRGVRVLLITATPVNNSLSDLYFLLRLRCPDDAFRDIGIGSLKVLLRSGSPSGADLSRLRGAVLVRRTRADVDPATLPMSFPRSVKMSAIHYELPLPPPEIAHALNDLTFIGYRLVRDGAVSPDLLRYAFLKRFESSRAAIASTLRRQIRFYEQLRAALAQNRILSPAAFRAFYTSAEDAVQLVFDEVALEPFHATDQALTLVDSELANLLALHARLRSATDAKTDALGSLLQNRNSNRTVVFTEFRDTAHALWRTLKNRFAVGLIDGQGAWLGATPARREQVIERFAPLANKAKVHPREEVSVLIATDVMAEGMNLQDANVVVSYDLPWNPVRLIQRAGRIDRLGSPHHSVVICNFIPDHEFDAFLGLAKTIRRKLVGVREAVGLDGPVLEPDEDFEQAMRAVVTSDSRYARPQIMSIAEPVRLAGVPCAGLRCGQKGAWVGLERAGDSAFVLVAETDAQLVDEKPVMALALECDAVRSVDLDIAAQAAETGLRYAKEHFALTTANPMSIASRIAERVRTELAVLDFEAGADTWAAASAVLEGVARPEGLAHGADLERILTRRFRSPSAFLQACLTVLHDPKHVAAVAEWRVSGVMVLN